MTDRNAIISAIDAPRFQIGEYIQGRNKVYYILDAFKVHFNIQKTGTGATQTVDSADIKPLLGNIIDYNWIAITSDNVADKAEIKVEHPGAAHFWWSPRNVETSAWATNKDVTLAAPVKVDRIIETNDDMTITIKNTVVGAIINIYFDGWRAIVQEVTPDAIPAGVHPRIIRGIAINDVAPSNYTKSRKNQQ